MSWDFETEPEFQEKLDWIDQFVADEIEPLEALMSARDIGWDVFMKRRNELKQIVKDKDLWACHLGPDLGGKGYGQVKLALMNEILGRSASAPGIFGAQAPDTGNMEILAHYGTDEQKKRWLDPLLAGEIYSAYSMTEPKGGSDPTSFTTRAERVGDEWVINGEKWFTSNGQFATILIVMAITNPDVSPYDGTSMFVVPKDTPGVNIVRNFGTGTEPIGRGNHAWIKYEDVRIPADHLLGPEGKAFAIAQTRLSGGRIHHAMRSVAQLKVCLDAMCERVLSRHTKGELLANKQMVQEQIADTWTDVQMFRLLVLQSAWKIDKYQDYTKVRKDIAAVKARLPEVLMKTIHTAMHIHGAIGVSNELPFARMWQGAPSMGIADGPSEVHKVTVAQQVLKDYEPHEGLWPRLHIPTRQEEARKKLAHLLEMEVANA
ncbi:MAG TPA: acyl-CoA dehydrogenase family protein [Actinomycetota bacterium]|nr:acyl-CoA dehydrogenase family protein [Actinomycetota bacterium]